MNSAAYWSKRAAKRMYNYQKQADITANKISKAYITATNYINTETAATFRTFAADGGMTEKEAAALLNNLPDKITLNNFKKVIGSITDPQIRRKLNSIINSPAYAYRIRRFEQLQKDIDTQTNKLAEFEQNTTKAHYVDLADNAYNRTMFDIQKGTGIGFSFASMPVSRIERILTGNWSGKLFSERIWGRAENINTKLKQELLVQFMTGRSYNKTAKVIEDMMTVGAMEARRLVRTESTYIANSAEIEAYKEGGIKKFKFSATLDMRTSAVCAAMDGKEFDVDKAKPGVNVPPLHPWCRSTTVAVIDGSAVNEMTRRARDPKTGKTYMVPENMTYADWKKSIDEKYGEGTWEKERKLFRYKNESKLTNLQRSDTIKKNNDTEVSNVHYIGKINRNIFKCVTKDIKTTDVIISDTQIQHIKDRHPNDYESLFKYAKEMIEKPDYILESKKPNTAFILKHIDDNDRKYEMILRLQTSNDPVNYKNSIITFLKVEEKRYNRYLRTKKILYKSE